MNLLKKILKKIKLKKLSLRKNITNYENHVSKTKNLWVKKLV